MVIPKFQNTLAWEQAQLLMQPIYIRVVDNIRKQLEVSSWRGTYTEVQEPIPGYHLCLSHEDQTVEVDLWELCFQVCLTGYPQQGETTTETVQVDTSLIDEEGQVDWVSLDVKTNRVITQVFANLPT